ncbi:Elongator complex protein 1 [Dichanthelium oligosanthes]|uniref:Elongator complex protein 1 n=1 Tax=Dichanthelium oligosanthes TaxID=888268 RepID=A0A1E5VHR2_9POAL|nr:Elongator complex protein 1 [Dichanthelium oligosanthes]
MASELPEDILMQVLAVLDVPDLARAGSFCSAWHGAYTSLCSLGRWKQPQTPCLLYTAKSRGQSAACLYSLAEKKPYTLALPDPPIRSSGPAVEQKLILEKTVDYCLFERMYIVQAPCWDLLQIHVALDGDASQPELESVEDVYFSEPDLPYPAYYSSRFEVYRVDMAAKKLVEISSLDESVLFLGQSQSLCLRAKECPQLNANHVYFTDDDVYKFFGANNRRRNIGVVSLGGGGGSEMRNLRLLTRFPQQLPLQLDGETLVASAVDAERRRAFFASSANFIYTVQLPTSSTQGQQSLPWSKIAAQHSDVEEVVLEPGDCILAMDYLMERESLLLGSSAGCLLLYNVEEKTTEVVGRLEGGVSTIASSPDGALLSVTTGLGQLLVITQDWEVLFETSLDPRVIIHRFAWTTAVSETSVALVIDGPHVLVTPLHLGLMPPPMSLFHLAFPCAVNEVSFVSSNSKTHLAAYLSNGSLCVVELPAPDTWEEFEGNRISVDPCCSDFTLDNCNKVTSVLMAVRKALEEQIEESSSRELCVLTTLARSEPPLLEEALNRIKVIRELELLGLDDARRKLYPSAEESLKHLLWLTDTEAVFGSALGLYDLNLAAIVALNSQKDPKEFLPFLKGLECLPPAVMRYTIDLRLGRYESALRNIVSAGNEYHEDCMKLLNANPQLFPLGLQLFNEPDKRNEILEAWGDHLSEEKCYGDAALTYQCCSSYEKSLKAYRACGDWKGVFTVAGLLELEKGEITQLAHELCDEFQALGKPGDAARVALEHDLVATVRDAASECAASLISEYQEGVLKVNQGVECFGHIQQRHPGEEMALVEHLKGMALTGSAENELKSLLVVLIQLGKEESARQVQQAADSFEVSQRAAVKLTEDTIFAALDLPDLIRAGSVCSAWHGACTSLYNLGRWKQPQTPCLLYTAKSRGESAACLYSLVEKKPYMLALPDPPIRRRRWLGSAYGWIITADERSELHLLNPIAGDQIDLPSVTTFEYVTPVYDGNGAVKEYSSWCALPGPYGPWNYGLPKLRDKFFQKVFLSSDPSSGDYIVAVIHNPYYKLSFARNGDDFWTSLPPHDGFADCVFKDGLLTASYQESQRLRLRCQEAAGLDIPDLIRSSSVCSSWHAAYTGFLRLGRCKPQQTPCLLYTAKSSGERAAGLYSLADKRAYTLPLPDPPIRSRHLIGSAHGWAVTADDRSELHLVNPVTGDQIALPSVTTMEHVTPVHGEDGAVRAYNYHDSWYDDWDDELDCQQQTWTFGLRKLRNYFFHKAFLSLLRFEPCSDL